MPYSVRQRIADALALDADAVRVTAPDVGGGFGTKGPVYPEELIVATLARRLGRPVRWTDTRQDSFLSTTHAGDQVHDVTLALGADGEILALADDFLIDAGAYLPRGAVVANVTAHAPRRPLSRAGRSAAAAASSSRTRCRARRTAAPGGRRPTFVGERILDIARARARPRSRRGAPPQPDPRGGDAVPPQHAVSRRRADGPRLRRLPDAARHGARHGPVTPGFRERQAAARREGRRIGLGVAAYNEATGIGPHEGARGRGGGDRARARDRRRAEPGPGPRDGARADLRRSAGRAARVDRRRGRATPRGFRSSMGTYASRIAVLVGNAVALAADAVRERVRAVAARALECDAGRRRDHRRPRPRQGLRGSRPRRWPGCWRCRDAARRRARARRARSRRHALLQPRERHVGGGRPRRDRGGRSRDGTRRRARRTTPCTTRGTRSIR